ncbi:geranylgeranyl reductase family [Klenkia soli]|uniref:Geranylgeranyl reductase family n=1 Tax=Klenkia soli TaxID=1052260 RepID=A0A1H0D9L5_9ACTN|nr:geranylgeranyl reductase family protein [Klenkia soli]SDN66779.1 geranylgeranyl reductase family [Klenkia soli]
MVDQQRDVVVVGAGPAGSSAAYWLARAGLDVLVLEKSHFPREKVCGDGLTPRGVAALAAMDVDVADDGWVRHRGLRVHGGGQVVEVDWPRLARWPSGGLIRTRADLDAQLARHAVAAGAEVRFGVTVAEPLLDDAGRVCGVRAADGEEFRSTLVISAEGLSGRLAKALGLNRRTDVPLGVAVRQYLPTTRSHDPYLDISFDLTDHGPDAESMPGYGWFFGMGDGTANVGFGLLDTRYAGDDDTRTVYRRWLRSLPASWGIDPDAPGTPLRGAGLPTSLSRRPAYTRGLLLVGDSAGTVNPFNGEGISYAMETGRTGAGVVLAALAKPAGPAREAELRRYPEILRREFGAHHRLGGLFLKGLARPELVRFATAHGLKRPAAVSIALRLMGNLSDGRDGDAVDRTLDVLHRLTPSR